MTIRQSQPMFKISIPFQSRFLQFVKRFSVQVSTEQKDKKPARDSIANTCVDSLESPEILTPRDCHDDSIYCIDFSCSRQIIGCRGIADIGECFSRNPSNINNTSFPKTSSFFKGYNDQSLSQQLAKTSGEEIAVVSSDSCVFVEFEIQTVSIFFSIFI